MVSDGHFTYNPLSNEDKELLLSHGYIPGEMDPEELHMVLRDLWAETEGDYDSEHSVDIGDEKDNAA